MTPFRGRIVRLALLGMLVSAAPAHAAPSGWASYSFTMDEAQKGKAIYAQSCASCHGGQLEGQGAPALAGPAFAKAWMRGDRTFGDLDHAIRLMPKQTPGSLPGQDYKDVLGYILSANGLAPSTQADSGSGLMATIPLATGTAQVASSSAAQPLPASPPSVAAAQANWPTDAELLNPAPSDWLMYNRTYPGDRFSPLSQITVANAAKLQPVCILQLGVPGSFQGSPIVYQGKGFVGSAYGVYAFDATTCVRKWTYTYAPDGPVGFPTNRGIALYDGKIFRGTPDGHLLAIDAETGKLLWNARVADGGQSFSISAAPVAANQCVFVGLAGGDFGIDGRFFAFDARTGAKLWSFDTIDRKTWPQGSETGGGASWTTVAIDPKANQVFVPIGNPAPDYYKAARPGDNLYTNSVVALDAATGKVAWYVQQLSPDFHDWDTAAAPALYEQGGRRYMAVGTKAGYLYIYDRDTHQLLSRSTVVPRLNEGVPLSDTPTRFCPGTISGVEWNGPAYDPASKSLFVNSVDWCSILTGKKLEGKRPGSPYLEADVAMEPLEQSSGWTRAFDAATGVERWARHAPRPMIGAVTPTAGGVVLTGGGDGMFLALDQHDGRVLYSFNVGGSIGGGIASYQVGNRQYVAVASGGYGLAPYGVDGSPTLVVFALPQTDTAHNPP